VKIWFLKWILNRLQQTHYLHNGEGNRAELSQSIFFIIGGISMPKWVSVGNKVSFKYNSTLVCSGEIVSTNNSGIQVKIKMKDVVIDGVEHETYEFQLSEIKQPSLNL
jgi:hypothetical protein